MLTTRQVGLTFGICLAALLFLAADDAKKPQPAAEKDAKADKDAPEKPAENPYSPRKGLSPAELRKFIERREDAPSSIHERPGYAEGIIEAAEQILAGQPDAELRRFALLAEFKALHDAGDGGNTDADKKLADLGAKYENDKDQTVAKEARFVKLERRALAADDLDPAELPKLLAELKQALSDTTLEHRHLRIASATVRIINRVPGDELAARSYKEFGELFSKSDDDDMASYGRRITKASRPPTLVGKPIEISGTTVDGAKFDIAEYKGKVVLVDFWASWCGPCRASMPALIQLHERFHPRGFEVVGVNLDKDFDVLGKFLDDAKLPWPSIVGEKDGDEMKFPLAEKYEIDAIPSTFLVGRDGKVVAHDLTEAQLTKKLEELFPGKPK